MTSQDLCHDPNAFAEMAKDSLEEHLAFGTALRALLFQHYTSSAPRLGSPGQVRELRP